MTRTKTRRAKAKTRPMIAGMTYAYIQLPEPLHESMKAIRQARWELEGVDPKICRIYQEAVRQYVQAKPQQRLLGAVQKALGTA